jgi:hypothetical protein
VKRLRARRAKSHMSRRCAKATDPIHNRRRPAAMRDAAYAATTPRSAGAVAAENAAYPAIGSELCERRRADGY